MSERYPTLARGSGRSPLLMIVPEQEIYAPRPPCTLCTWVVVSRNRSRLKYVNTSCHLHQGLRRLPA